MPAPELVPKCEIPLDMEVFGHSLAVGGIGGAPVVQRVHVEVLSIVIDALLVEHVVNVLDEPAPSLDIAQVQKVPAQ